MGVVGEVNPKPREEIEEEQVESDQRLIVKNMVEVSSEVEVKPRSSKEFPTTNGQDEKGCQGISVEETEVPDVVQDQVIIAPEIMTLILEKLDLRSLKNARLVCKSWLRVAQTPMTRRTIVRFQMEDFPPRVKSFNETRQKKLEALPNPFESIDLGTVYSGSVGSTLDEGLLGQLQILTPPLLIKRVDLSQVPFGLAFPLIIQWSSCLEYLELYAGSYEAGYLPPMDPEQMSFPKLRHINTKIWGSAPNSTEETVNHFPSIVAWIVNASPNLETYESWSDNSNMELGSELFLKVNIENVKALILTGFRLNNAASEHLVSIPFRRLQHLKLHVYSPHPLGWIHHALLAVVTRSAHTLVKLDLTNVENQVSYSLLNNSKFPVCPLVQELSLTSFQYWKHFLANSFPSLRTLHMEKIDLDAFGGLWTDLPPFLDLTTLRANNMYFHYHRGRDDPVMAFLEKFPAVERLRLDVKVLLECCRLKATGEPRFSHILEAVKHVELLGDYFYGLESTEGGRYSFLPALQGIETVTMFSSNQDIVLIPFQELPRLKIIQFPWGDCLNLEKLLEIAQGVERVVVTNCCCAPRVGNEVSKDLLYKFLESAPNAVCMGVESGKKYRPSD